MRDPVLLHRTPEETDLAGLSALDDALRRARDHLYALQEPGAPFWHAELEANSTLTSEYIFFSHILDRVTPERERMCVAELLSTQLGDGGWGIGDGRGGEISTSIEAYVALRLAGLAASAETMLRARAFILANGGLQGARMFTRIHLALLGLWPYDQIPSIPPALLMVPGLIYRMASWARSCVVPLIVILAHRPRWRGSLGLTIDELLPRGGAPEAYAPPKPPAGASWEYAFATVERAIRSLDRLGVVPLRKSALRRAERYILERQDDEGDWGGIFPAMTYSMVALVALGYPLHHPTIVRGWAAIERFGREREGRLRFESCVSPVWDTALALLAIRDAGGPADEPRLQAAGRWLLDKQVRHYGDWSVRNPEGSPGGWSFEFNNRYFPDNDDTAAVILALQSLELGSVEEAAYRDASIGAARGWVLSMQCKGGGWGAFDVDNDDVLWNRIPFADHGAMLDPPTPDLTGRVLEMLGNTGSREEAAPVRRALRWLAQEQRADGSWFGRWGVNFVYGTWAVLCGLAALKLDASEPMVLAGARFLTRAQNPDGGWGESCLSYDHDRFIPAPSCPSQTAWGVMGLLAAGEDDSLALLRGVRWLLKHQREDGGWDEAAFTGTGFPQHFYIRYHLYRDCFPTRALGLFARRQRSKPEL
jgi:squalene-hopene/tetraprenyl-beta-curcumene cyclase